MIFFPPQILVPISQTEDSAALFASDFIFTPSQWNKDATLTNGPYILSKRLAEEAAWEFASAHREIELAVVNPVMVFGPTISGEHINTSLSNLKKLILGEPGICLGWIIG